MLIGILFWALTVIGCAYAAVAGGKDGRWAAGMILCAAVLSIPAAHLGRGWARTEIGVMAVDALLLAGLYVLAMASRRHFPLWMAGFQLIAVTTHIATAIAPSFTPPAYRAMEGLWAIPTTVSLVLGTWLDSRRS